MFHPGNVLAVKRFLYGDVDHDRGRAGAMPVLFVGRKPDNVASALSRSGPPQLCTRPMPERMHSVWPNGWVCQAVHEPGSKRTKAERTRAGSGASTIGSCQTTPVKYSAAARRDGTEPQGWMFMLVFLHVATRPSHSFPARGQASKR